MGMLLRRYYEQPKAIVKPIEKSVVVEKPETVLEDGKPKRGRKKAEE